MKNVNKNNRNIIILLIGVISISTLISIYLVINNTRLPVNKHNTSPETAITQQETKIYKSENMKFSVDIPSYYNFKDNDVVIEFISGRGNISVSRNGTNFSSLEEYLIDDDSRKNIEVSDSRRLTINGYQSLTRLINYPEENIRQKSYYIFVNSFVFIISTKYPSLFDDLDQIAQSFRYTP